MTMIWWEKTVEYLFAKKCLGESSFMPLDGEQEKAGDLLVFQKSNMLIIEFKRDKKSLSSEKKKFEKWEDVKEDAKKYVSDNFHLLVYGVLNNTELNLKASSYWQQKDIDNLEFSEVRFQEYINQHGKSLEDLKGYLDFLFEHKKSIDGTAGSGGFSNCAIISAANGKVKTLSLDEFIEGYHIELALKKEKELALKEEKKQKNIHSLGPKFGG